MNVAILGCGPSGLLAARAADVRGHKVDLYSRKVKSEINGAMFMHASIPGISDVAPEFMIDIIKSGVREGYAENVYGDPSHPVSWDKFEGGPFPAWDLRAAYDKLWERWEGRILSIEITQAILLSLIETYDKVISTVPANAICALPDVHRFDSQRIWIERMEGGLIERVNDDNLMYYNGYTRDGKYGMIGPPWYRYCQINGLRSWEYARPPSGDSIADSMVEGYKPTGTNCDCWPQIMKLGRFGAWQKQVLTHHVYEAAYHAL
jgi:hypothetical protein